MRSTTSSDPPSTSTRSDLPRVVHTRYNGSSAGTSTSNDQGGRSQPSLHMLIIVRLCLTLLALIAFGELCLIIACAIYFGSNNIVHGLVFSIPLIPALIALSTAIHPYPSSLNLRVTLLVITGLLLIIAVWWFSEIIVRDPNSIVSQMIPIMFRLTIAHTVLAFIILIISNCCLQCCNSTNRRWVISNTRECDEEMASSLTMLVHHQQQVSPTYYYQADISSSGYESAAYDPLTHDTHSHHGGSHHSVDHHSSDHHHHISHDVSHHHTDW